MTPDGRLRLELRDPGWIATRRLDDLVTDHGHLMHLFVVSPALDRLWHLHPDEVTTGTFEHRLPEMPAGDYELFADLVHETGLSETVTGTLSTRRFTARRCPATTARGPAIGLHRPADASCGCATTRRRSCRSG